MRAQSIMPVYGFQIASRLLFGSGSLGIIYGLLVWLRIGSSSRNE